MAEREGFEPPCRLPDKTLSRRPRYDHFGTSPFIYTLAVAFGDFPPALALASLASRLAPAPSLTRSPSATSLRRSLWPRSPHGSLRLCRSARSLSLGAA